VPIPNARSVGHLDRSIVFEMNYCAHSVATWINHHQRTTGRRSHPGRTINPDPTNRGNLSLSSFSPHGRLSRVATGHQPRLRIILVSRKESGHAFIAASHLFTPSPISLTTLVSRSIWPDEFSAFASAAISQIIPSASISSISDGSSLTSVPTMARSIQPTAAFNKKAIPDPFYM
jgi:hypothetical protein